MTLMPKIMEVLIAGAALAVLAARPAAADDFKAAVEDLAKAERSRSPEPFAFAARHLLKDDSARAVREVLASYARLTAGKPALPAVEHYRLHSELAKALGDVKSAPACDEIRGQRAKSPSWQARLLALDAASFRPEPMDLRGGAIALLRDPSPVVVRRALEYLKKDRRLVVVDSILARFLEVDLPRGPRGDDWNRLRYALRSALTALLRVNLPMAADYQSYLVTRRDNPQDLFDNPRPPSRGPTGMSIFGAEVTGTNIVFVIDISGSMLSTDPVVIADSGKSTTAEEDKAREGKMLDERRRILRAKKELTNVVQALPPGKQFNIISYSTEVTPWKKSLAAVSPAAKKEAVEFIAAMKAEGITVTDEAMEAAFTDLSVDTIYLITDGAPTHVGNNGPDEPPDAQQIIERIHRWVREVNYFRGIRICTLGFPEADETFLKKLAADNGGEYTPIR